MSEQRGTLLTVPYAEKDEAKALGAKWDPDIRRWFVPKGVDDRPFGRWMSESGTEQMSQRPGPTKRS